MTRAVVTRDARVAHLAKLRRRTLAAILAARMRQRGEQVYSYTYPIAAYSRDELIRRILEEEGLT